MSVGKQVSIGKASEFTGLGVQTLRRLAKKGSVAFYKTDGGQYIFNLESLQAMCGHVDAPQKKRKNIIYCRVSSKKQEDDLQRQIEYMRSQFPSYEAISDIGSGIDFKRKGVKDILGLAMQRNIKELVVAHNDRLCRFGFDLFKQLIELQGRTLKVLENDGSHRSDEQELADDLLSILHIFLCRQMGRRKYFMRNNENKIV